MLARQRGFKWRPGDNVYAARNHTLLAAKEGVLAFSRDPFTTGRKRIYMHIIEQEVPNRVVMPPPPFMQHPELYPELAANNPDPKEWRITIK